MAERQESGIFWIVLLALLLLTRLPATASYFSIDNVNLALSLALSDDYGAAVAALAPVAMAPGGSVRERQSLALIYGLQGNDTEAARIGRIDLDQASVEHNLAIYRMLRELPPGALSRAILSAGSNRPTSGAS